MVSGQFTNKERDHLKSHSKEGIKMFIEYDGSNRMEFIYEAPTDAEHGAPALQTQYEYDGGSSRIAKMKESQTTWDSSWDI